MEKASRIADLPDKSTQDSSQQGRTSKPESHTQTRDPQATAPRSKSQPKELDVRLLEVGARVHEANLEKLRTWSGRVRVTRTNRRLTGAEDGATGTRAVAFVDFAYDRSKQAKCWVWHYDAEKSQGEANGNGIAHDRRMSIVLRNGMIKDGAFYHSKMRGAIV